MSVKSYSVAVGSDAPYSADVKWYAGGTQAAETRTVTSSEASNKYVELAKTAEYGSVVATLNGTMVEFRELQSDHSTESTNTSDTDFILFGTGVIAENDVLVIHYIDVETATPAIVHVATCMDVSIPMSAETKSQAVQGQSTELQKVGSIKTTMTMEKVQMDLILLGQACGDLMTDDDGNVKWTNAFHGFNKIGCIIGEEQNSAGVLKRKWIVYGATCSGLTFDMPVNDFYKESLEFAVDEVIVCQFGNVA
jgi:hypothetical protein